MKRLHQNYPALKVILLLFLVTLPWLGLQSNIQLDPPLPSQEDLTFYEINPCKVSLSTFIKSNFNTVYQDHYFFRFSSSSPLSCFGLISGATLIDTDLYISVGTNPLVNLILQASFWTLIISFIKKEKETAPEYKKFVHYLSLSLASITLCLFVYVEERFYQTSFYQLDVTDRRYFLILLLAAFFTIKNLVDVAIPRISNLIYFVPASYFVINVLEGFNIHFFSFLFLYYGFISFATIKKITFQVRYLIFITSFWIINSAYTGSGFYFAPGKLRGFTSSVYSFYSTLMWSIFFITLVSGIIFVYKSFLKELDIHKFTQTFAFSSIFLVIFGYLGANFPLINLFNYYYFGQQRYGITLKNPFFFNEWAEKVSWRGFYPSAETVGEYFGLVLILIYFCYRKQNKISIVEFFGFIFASFGLYFSNNRAAMIFVIFTLLYYSTKKFSFKIRSFTLLIFSIFFLYVIGFQNLGYDYNFISSSIIDQANTYKLMEQSSFLQSLNNSQSSDNFSFNVFRLVSAGSYLLNRSEVWGVFSAQFNPTYLEILFGSGPLNFGQLYGEIDIKPTRGVLLPHSSLISYFVFIGGLGILIVIYKFITKLRSHSDKINDNSVILLTYIFANIIKNDSLNYFPTFILYSLFIYIILNLDNEKIFK